VPIRFRVDEFFISDGDTSLVVSFPVLPNPKTGAAVLK
jgi:hypothetical protein